jgi:hypothetical protein
VQSTAAARQRGMPRMSCLHVFFVRTLPEQQSALALHWTVCSRQIPPAGVQAFPLSQRPIGSPAALEQVTSDRAPSGRVADPQQSASSLQISPVGWQPLGG